MDIFQENSYKQYVRQRVTSGPKKGRGHWQKMAKFLNVSTTLVSQVFNGERDLTIEQAFDLCRFWGLSELESEYFILLVEKERAGNEHYKDHILEKIRKVKEQSKDLKNRLPQDQKLDKYNQSIFYSNWLYMAIWVLSSIPQFQSFEAIKEQLQIDPDKLREMLNFLTENNICHKEGDIITVGPQRIHLEASSPLIGRHHTNWRLKSLEKVHDISKQELMFTAPLSIGEKDFPKVRDLLLDTITKIGQIVEKSESETPACLNIDFIQWIESQTS